MTTILKNAMRNGSFTSSEINALWSEPAQAAKNKGEIFGAGAKTLIAECNYERKLGRSITVQSDSKPTTWGKLIEGRVFELLPTSYQLCSTETLQHPIIEYWAGSPDGRKFDEGGTVMDIKSPQTLKSFCELVAPMYEGLTGLAAINKMRDIHKEGDKYYWQLVSNAILTDSKFAELIVYVPYLSELPAIREYAKFPNDSNDKKYSWIGYASDEELPYLVDGGYYNNLNIIRFEVPQADKDLLTERVKEAGKLLQ